MPNFVPLEGGTNGKGETMPEEIRPENITTEQADVSKTIERIAEQINAHLETLTPRLAVAIYYQTCQAGPPLYLCHESLEHCLAGFHNQAQPAKVQAQIEVLQRRLIDGPPHIERDLLRDQLGPLFNPGDWSNPADDVLLDPHNPDPTVTAWAKAAFDAVETAVRNQQSSTEARAHIRLTLWAALDRARRTFTGQWPPISFVIDGDDYMEDILPFVVKRRDDGS
jgi:hypothetical protein